MSSWSTWKILLLMSKRAKGSQAHLTSDLAIQGFTMRWFAIGNDNCCPSSKPVTKCLQEKGFHLSSCSGSPWLNLHSAFILTLTEPKKVSLVTVTHLHRMQRYNLLFFSGLHSTIRMHLVHGTLYTACVCVCILLNTNTRRVSMIHEENMSSDQANSGPTVSPAAVLYCVFRQNGYNCFKMHSSYCTK